MSDRQARKHKRACPEDLPPAKREHRTGTKRTLSEDDVSDVESDMEAELSQIQTQDAKESVVTAREAEAGVLEKVELFDFMCHKHLELNLSPNVNFILGRNGSGKSAIMTGIVVALGGKARSTERGSSLKQFIRTEANSARVVVHLRNRGLESYKPEEYGDTIICERCINRDGSGQYKIKSAKGKVISTKKDELVALMDHCNIQIDNPVSLLNQDTSRNFLHNSKPGAKYKLFMKATHLEQIALDYQQSREEHDVMQERIKRMQLTIPALADEAKKLEEKVESFKRFSEMEEKISQLENEQKWVIVAEIEATVPPIERDISKEKNRIPRNEGRVRVAQRVLDSAEQEVKEAQDGLNEITKEIKQVHAERSSVTAEKRDKMSELRRSQNILSQISKKIGEDEKEKAALERAKQESILASQRDVKGEREARMKEMEELKEQLRRMENEIATAENDKAQFQAAVQRTEDAKRSLESQEGALNDQIRTSEAQLRRLQSSRNDKLAAYGEDMRALVNELQRQQRRFRHPPKGPIGSMISLPDYKWSTAIEQVVKRGTLLAFVVDNQQDANTYMAIAKRVVRNGSIPDAIRSRFQGTPYDVRRHRAQCSHPTVYDMLEVSDPDVMNVLIDQCHVESVLLIEDRETANRVITHERPPNAREAYTITGDQILPGRHYSNKSRPLGIIKANLDDTIKEERERFDQLRESIQQLRREGQSLTTECNTNKGHVTGLTQKIRRRLGDKKKLSIKLMELNNAREEEEEPEENIATYEAEIAELEEQIAGKVRERTAQQEVVAGIKAELEEINRRSSQTERKVDRVTVRSEELSAQLHESENKKKQAEKRLKTGREKVDEINNIIAQLEGKLEEQLEAVQEAVAAAEESCERIETDKSLEAIRSEISSLKRRISEDQPSMEEQEEVRRQYIEAMEKFQNQKKLHKTMKRTILELKKSLNHRISNYHRLQERVATRTCVFFTLFLRQRDYDGKLKFDYQKEQLVIEVKVDSHTHQSQATSNARQLSGGERSFTTVCFIMALWDAITAPFRCLDEFDVFMDMLNRKISMRMMMQMAQDHPSKQFVFFTPQDMSSMGITGGRMVKMVRLQDPIRHGQATLTS